MGYAEVIYETGDKSVVSFDTLDELKAGLFEHNRRAINGEPGSAQDYLERDDIEPELSRQAARVAERPAERVKRVLLYDKHPADFSPVGNEGNQPVDAATVVDLVSGMTDSAGKINLHQLNNAMRDEASPVYPRSQGRHESMFKMKELEELDMSFLDAAAGDNDA